VEYVWDSNKDADNRRHHGLALADGIPALEDPNAEAWIDDRFAYGEERILTLGLNRTRVLLVVTIELGVDVTRIISVRRAEKHEERWYYEGKP
jgi:uncharacterized DUF497 family protein